MNDVFAALNEQLGTAIGAGSVLAYGIMFLLGLAASITPCTYPVLPLTVGYIGNCAAGSKAKAFFLSLAMVLGMALVYAVAGMIFAGIGTQFGVLLGKGWFLYGVAMFFIVMALFLLDVFAFPVPKFVQGLSGAGRGRTDALGALIVGGVSGLIVGPCTGPILAVALGYIVAGLRESQGIGFVGQVLGGGLKLFVFAIGQGALVLLCGTFTGLLSHLPRAGQWMVTVKKGFALVILIGASLLLVFVGQNTDFPSLTRFLGGLEASSAQKDAGAPAGPGEFGGDEFLD